MPWQRLRSGARLARVSGMSCELACCANALVEIVAREVRSPRVLDVMRDMPRHVVRARALARGGVRRPSAAHRSRRDDLAAHGGGHDERGARARRRRAHPRDRNGLRLPSGRARSPRAARRHGRGDARARRTRSTCARRASAATNVDVHVGDGWAGLPERRAVRSNLGDGRAGSLAGGAGRISSPRTACSSYR